MEKHDEITLDKKYDRCTCAAGIYRLLWDLKDIEEVLKEYTGKVLYSSEVCKDLDVKRKTVMMISDSLVGEDLVIIYVKMGTKKVHICTRSG